MPADVTVALIGDFSVVVDGRSITRSDFERASGADLVQLLALSERNRLPRDQIIDALWPDASFDAASNQLNKAASYARKAIGHKAAIVVKDGTVSLFPAATVRVDYHEAVDVDTANADAVNHVLNTHHGELLPDSLYAEWTIEARSRLRLLQLDLLRQKSRWLDVLKLDGTDEEAYLELMTQAIERGDRDDVVRRFDQLETTLREELDVEPSSAAMELRDQALAADSQRAERALKSLASTPNNLPIQLSSFVGREDEIVEVTDLMRHSQLVTLTGIGGVGKTRLALQVADGLLGEFDDGVWFVELAPLLEPGLIADAFAEPMNIKRDPVTPVRERVLAHLANRQVLLVVDNCEHLIDELAALVDDLLRFCPRVQVLATSRMGLFLTGEILWRVPSLDSEAGGAALDLFVDRARLARAGFDLSDTNREAVAAICRRLDGIPLAIELATARLHSMTVDQILEHLDDRFLLLMGSSRTAVERQRTLRAMMDWSYDMLDAEEQTLLCRLAVFADGFTYEAANAVDTGQASSPLHTLGRLSPLVDASLVTFTGGDTPRYRLLETVRQFGFDRLAEAGEVDDPHFRHCEYFAASAQELLARLEVREPDAMRLCQDELGNYRAAMAWASDADRGDLVLGIAVALRHVFWPEGMNRESLRWLLAGLDLSSGDQTPLTDRAVGYALGEANYTANAERILELSSLARERLVVTEDETSRGLLANALGLVKLFDDLGEGDRLLVEAYRVLKSVGDPIWKTAITNRMLSGWWMNSTEVFAEILANADLGADKGLGIVSEPILRVAAAVVAPDFDQILSSHGGFSTLSVWEEAVLVYSKTYAFRATGQLDEALALKDSVDRTEGVSLDQFLVRFQFALAHIDRGELREAIVEFVPFRTDTSFGSATASWFGSLVAERQGRYEDSALLAGFSNRISREVAYSPHVHDATLFRESQAVARRHLGGARAEQFHAEGSTADWHDLSRLTVDHD